MMAAERKLGEVPEDYPGPNRGDWVAIRDGGEILHRRVQSVWNETAEGSLQRGPMVVVYVGGGAPSIPVAYLAAWSRTFPGLIDALEDQA
jgi:hypothetical protein